MNQMTPVTEPVSQARPPAPGELTQRAARRSELGYVHKRLVEAIDGIEDFSDEFRAFERARLSKSYLADLHSIDPNHIRACFAGETMTGFLISGPECGNLWYYWGYVFPEVRTPKMAMVYLRLFLEHWDNSRFHKVSLYTTRTNRPTLALMKRFRFEHKCDLNNHVMGQDFMLFERPLNKVVPGYDHGTSVGRATRLRNRMLCALGLI